MTDLPTRARDALRRLHEQGRIASPWLPGMVAVEIDGARWRARLGDGGMLRGEGEPSGYVGSFEACARTMEWCPDPHDPATQGCLLALAEEAGATAMLWLTLTLDDGDVMDPKQRAVALVVALEALAGQP